MTLTTECQTPIRKAFCEARFLAIHRKSCQALSQSKTLRSSRQRPGIEPLTIRYYYAFLATVSRIQNNLHAAMKDALRIQVRFLPNQSSPKPVGAI
jgi:hypothetical protein